MDRQLRECFDAMPVGIAVLEPDRRVLYASPALATLVGRAASELEGTSFDALSARDGSALAHANGSLVPVAITLAPLSTSEGPRIVATVLDLRATSTDFETAFRRSPRPTWIFDAETWRFLAANHAMCERYGYTESELLESTIEILRGPEEQARLRAEMVRPSSPVERYRGTWRHRARDGTEFWVEVEGRALTFRGRSAHIVSAEDITDRMEADCRVAAAHAELDAILGSAPLPISTVDGNGIVRAWNDAAERAFGWTREEIVGKPHPFREPGEGYADRVKRALELDGVRSYEVQRTVRDGRLRTIEIHVSVIALPDGRRAGLAAVMIDVTEQRAIDARLRAAERLEAVGLVAGGVSHDFNNLLTAVLANAELALVEVAPDDEMHALLEDIRDAAERASALTRQLLAFTRQQPIEPQHTDVNGRLRVIERMLRRLIRADVELRLELAPIVPPVWCDPTQIDQLVMNLVLNARDAIGESGTIRISTRHDTGDANGKVVLTIEDDGPGVPPELLPQIFTPFVSTKAAGKGTGLGLAIVQRIVEGCGGSVTVTNVEPHGARFEVRLPASQRVSVTADDGAAPLRGGHETILLVEDDPDVRSAARRILANLGYQVLEARGVRDAQRVYALAERPVDLAFVDLVLPDGSGHALGMALRARDPRLPVLYTSGFSPEAGAWEGSIGPLLGKPYDATTLGRRIRAMLDERKPV